MEKQLQSKHKPKISVIMSVKDGYNTLSKAIDSIINQTFKEWEFIICDDGSTDDTYSLLLEYAKLDSRICVIRNTKSHGLAYSLNECIKLSKSNILARQDADDYSDMKRFEIQYKFVVEHPQYAIVGTCWYNVDEHGKSIECYVKNNPTARDMIRGGLYLHPSWMMRKDMIQKVGYYTVNKYTMRSQDYHLMMKIFGAGMQTYNIQELLYYYTVDNKTINRFRSWGKVRGLMWIRYDSYRRNSFPFWSYIYVLKPLVTNLIPGFIMSFYYRNTLLREEKFKNNI